MSSVGQLVPRVTKGPPNITIPYNGPQVEGSFCLALNFNFDPTISVICAMYIVFGLVYTIFGYRCFKASMFLTGFTFGSAIVYLICLQEHLLPPYGNVAVAVCAGLLFGLITMLIQYVGLFMTGFHTGLLLALAGLAIYDHFLDNRPTTYWLCVVSLLLSGIFFAVLNLYWKKVMTIFGTSVYGGAVIATSIDYFLERMMMLKWLWERAKLEPAVAPPCMLSWLALAAWPAAAIVGFTAQCALTATGIYHEQSMEVQSKWKTLRDGFTRYCRTLKKKSGSAASKAKQYIYYNQLLFLKDVTEDKGQSVSNFDASSQINPQPTVQSTEKEQVIKKQRKRQSDGEDALIEILTKKLYDKQDKAERDPSPATDEDKSFLLSLVSDFNKISSDWKLDAKFEIIRVMKHYKDLSISQMSHFSHNNAGYSTTTHAARNLEQSQSHLSRPESQTSVRTPATGPFVLSNSVEPHRDTGDRALLFDSP